MVAEGSRPVGMPDSCVPTARHRRLSPEPGTEVLGYYTLLVMQHG
jgi:hypothetical protein